MSAVSVRERVNGRGGKEEEKHEREERRERMAATVMFA